MKMAEIINFEKLTIQNIMEKINSNAEKLANIKNEIKTENSKKPPNRTKLEKLRKELAKITAIQKKLVKEVQQKQQQSSPALRQAAQEAIRASSHNGSTLENIASELQKNAGLFVNVTAKLDQYDSIKANYERSKQLTKTERAAELDNIAQ